MTDGGLVADLFEEGGCQLTLALVDPKAIIADGPKGPIPCADANCPASPFAPQARFDGTRGFCKSDDTESFRFIATLHTPQPPIRCLHCTHLRDVNARACLTLVCCTVSAEAITLSWLQKIRSQTLSTAAESTAR